MDDYFINIDLTTEEGRASYISEISRIKSSSQSAENKLNLLDILIRDFLRKRFHIKKTAEYSEMIEFFLEKNKPHIAVFCHSMIKQLYAGDGNDQNSVSLLLEEAKRMIEEEMYGYSEVESKHSKSLFSRIFGSKNKKSEKESPSPRKVGKQTEKIIEKALSPQITDESENGMPKKSNDVINSLRSKLDISLIENESKEQEELEDKNESIQNIDDLERIKKKIVYKKQALAKEKLQKEKEEQEEQQEELLQEKEKMQEEMQEEIQKQQEKEQTQQKNSKKK
ncbi:MAG: hypothetical protein AABX85_04340 [Nanoarchaeota archaeon]